MFIPYISLMRENRLAAAHPSLTIHWTCICSSVCLPWFAYEACPRIDLVGKDVVGDKEEGKHDALS